jgi:hypothetical protein
MHGFIERDMGNIGSIPLSQHHIIMLTLFINDLMNVIATFSKGRGETSQGQYLFHKIVRTF